MNSRNRLPVGTIPGIIILIVLLVLGIAMWRLSGPGSGGASSEGSMAHQQPDYSHAERREPGDPFTMGPVDAPVGLVVFSDYQCPFCAQWARETLPVMEELADKGELRIEHRDVNVYGPSSKRAAIASFAASRQGRFWDFHHALFDGGRTRSERDLSEGALIRVAEALGMDGRQFARDMSSPEATDEIERNQDLGIEHGATSTPVFILGGAPLVGAQPTDVFLQAYDDAVRSAGR